TELSLSCLASIKSSANIRRLIGRNCRQRHRSARLKSWPRCDTYPFVDLTFRAATLSSVGFLSTSRALPVALDKNNRARDAVRQDRQRPAATRVAGWALFSAADNFPRRRSAQSQ